MKGLGDYGTNDDIDIVCKTRNMRIRCVDNRIDFVLLWENVRVDLVVEIWSFTESHDQRLFNIDDDAVVRQLDAPKISAVRQGGQLWISRRSRGEKNADRP